MPDSRIDFSDIPEASDEELRHARRVGRPATGQAKQLIAIRIAPRLLAELRQMAARQHKPYQTLVHELLDAAVKRVAERAAEELTFRQVAQKGPDARRPAKGRVRRTSGTPQRVP